MTKKEYKEYYESKAFKEQYVYDGTDLGAVCDGDCTYFRLWSPLAEAVTLNLYKDGETEEVTAVSMEKAEKGTWTYTLEQDGHAVYYDYTIEMDGKSWKTADPYAKACACNGNRSMAVDLKRTNPDGWELDCAPAEKPEQVVYEIHVKDFSNDPASGVPDAYRGKYKAFTLEGTTLNGDGIHPTCLDYLKQLGVTHVQLLPVYDYGSVDEAGDDSQFNWGYDPQNYNVPEGSYSTDPFHGEVRIRELKELIMTMHQHGIGVIMDVVYNHTYSMDSCLTKTVPYYFYRQFADGSTTNGSACGNDMASDREMCAKYIFDSVLYWTEEYHMDGFRFDLMGLLDVELMNRIRKALDEKYGKGKILMYGEPWRAAESPLREGYHPALKENANLLDENIGMFCDNTRDAVKGHVFEEKEPGFVNGGTGFEKKMLQAAKGWMGVDKYFPVQSPKPLITYVSAHDNLTLWDKLKITMKPEASFLSREEDIVKANKMAAAICFTCPGRLFFQAGEESARTKLGDENSYISSPEINQIDWERVYEYQDIAEYYRGLIAFRQQMPGLTDKTAKVSERVLDETVISDHVVQFSVDNHEHTRWELLTVCYNASKKAVVPKLSDGTWECLIDGDSSFRWQKPQAAENAEIKPGTVSVFGRIKK